MLFECSKLHTLLSKEGISFKMFLQIKQYITAINSELIQRPFLFCNFIGGTDILPNRLLQILVIFFCNIKAPISAGILPCGKNKQTFGLNKTTQPPAKIAQSVHRKILKLLLHKVSLFIFLLSAKKIGFCVFRAFEHFFKERKLHGQARGQRGVLFQNFQGFVKFNLFITNPLHKGFFRTNLYISYKEPIFQRCKHLNIRRCVFEFDNKPKLQMFLSPMIYLNTSISVHQSNPKLFIIFFFILFLQKQKSQAPLKIFIVQCYVNSPVCQYDTSKPTNGEQYQESQCKQHGSSQPQGPSVEGPEPTEDFNTSRYGNNHCGTCEISTSVNVQTYCIHVVHKYK